MTDEENPDNDGRPTAEADRGHPRIGPAPRLFPIVGIGASAGGLDALRTLFQSMPADTGMGFVVTQHLDAGHDSLLADLLSKFTSMRVVQVENGMSVEPNRIYVIPPNAYMTISDGILLLKPPSDARGMRMPIDRFLFSLAEDQSDQAIGIVLSGTGTDGTLGIREIKANGGMVMVQDPETAQYDGMPRSAMATGQADAVLALERMPGVLLSYIRHAYTAREDPALPGMEAGYDPLTAELETSKEELQSLNEELTTVNNQLQNKILEVETTNNDLSNLLSSSNIATLFLDRELRIKRFTPATAKLMNLIATDVGRPMADIARKYANDNLPADCRKVLEDLQPVERELLSEGGEWFIRRVQPYCTQDNRIEGTVVTFSDVTAIKHRDEEHSKLASIVESSENAIVGMSLEGIVTSWNPGAEASFGYRAGEVIGTSLDPLFPNRDRGEATRILEEVRAGRRVGPYETEGVRKDGSQIQLSVSISPIRDAAGHAVAASTIARDITERKLAETALRERVALQDQLTKIAATVPGVICSYRLRADGSSCVPYASPAIEELLDVTPRDVSEDFGPIQARIHPDDAGHVSETTAESARTLTPFRATFRYRHPTKGEIWIEAHSVPAREPDGSTLWHGYVHDITERKGVELSLLDADRRKNEFLAVLGHELRNPLAPIRNAVHVLSRQETLPERIRWAVDLIGRQSEQLEQLVNDLLDFARITGLRVQLRISPVVVQDALEDALLSAAPLVEKCGQALETWFPETPVVVMANPVRLAQVFTNLLRNAVKYTPDGGHIWVTLGQEGQEAVVRVRDDGIGIRPEYLPRLFDFFSRGETEHPDTQDADGLGVGLALAKQLMLRHGGTLEGRSSGPGLGSEFIVTLPVYSKVKPPASPVDSKTDTGAQPQARRILVVDDNPDVADSFRVLLEAMGHRVRTLNAGGEVLAVIRIFHPDVVFLDIGMPDMDGYQVVTAVGAAELAPRPLLVALTGYGQDRDRKATLAAGFDRHLLKPPDPKEIEALLADLG